MQSVVLIVTTIVAAMNNAAGGRLKATCSGDRNQVVVPVSAETFSARVPAETFSDAAGIGKFVQTPEILVIRLEGRPGAQSRLVPNDCRRAVERPAWSAVGSGRLRCRQCHTLTDASLKGA